MLEVYRFKRKYNRLKERRRNNVGEWEITAQDVLDLVDALPHKTVKHFDQRHVRFLKRYSGRVYYPSTDELLDAIRDATLAIRNGEYLDTAALELKTIDINDWIQPTQLACNFGFLLEETRRLFGELIGAYNTSTDDKVNYNRRKTVRIVSDVFSLAEVLSELVLAGKELDG